MPTPPDNGEDATEDSKAETLLVVDDDAMTVDVLSSILRYDGFRVLVAYSGTQALEIADRERLDAILLDVKMPDMDGFEVIRRLKSSKSASVPVVFISAQVFDGGSIRRGLELGARDYIPKPLNKPELLARISSVLRVHKMERQLRAKNESLNNLDHRRREYLAMASHDLKVPLHSVATYCAILMQGGYGPITSEQWGAISRIRAQVNYMKILVSNLLDLEKIEDGSLQVERSETDLPALLREVFETNKPAADEKNMQIVIETEGELGKPLLDSQKMLQIVNNLVGNAIKFAPENSSVTLGVRRKDSGLELHVADAGPGIPVEEQPLMFRPFQQLSVKSTTRERGAGLGLCIVKNLVEMQGGTVTMESVPGRGSRFSLFFPNAACETPHTL